MQLQKSQQVPCQTHGLIAPSPKFMPSHTARHTQTWNPSLSQSLTILDPPTASKSPRHTKIPPNLDTPASSFPHASMCRHTGHLSEIRPVPGGRCRPRLLSPWMLIEAPAHPLTTSTPILFPQVCTEASPVATWPPPPLPTPITHRQQGWLRMSHLPGICFTQLVARHYCAQPGYPLAALPPPEPAFGVLRKAQRLQAPGPIQPPTYVDCGVLAGLPARLPVAPNAPPPPLGDQGERGFFFFFF